MEPPQAFFEFEMCKLLGCTPSQLDQEDFFRVMEFWEIKNAFEHEKWLESMRARQAQKR